MSYCYTILPKYGTDVFNNKFPQYKLNNDKLVHIDNILSNGNSIVKHPELDEYFIMIYTSSYSDHCSDYYEFTHIGTEKIYNIYKSFTVTQEVLDSFDIKTLINSSITNYNIDYDTGEYIYIGAITYDVGFKYAYIEKYFINGVSLYKFWFNIDKMHITPIGLRVTKIYDHEAIIKQINNLNINLVIKTLNIVLERNKTNKAANYFSELIKKYETDQQYKEYKSLRY